MLVTFQAARAPHASFPREILPDHSLETMCTFCADETMKIRLENEMLKKKLEKDLSFFLSIMGMEKCDLETELAAQKVSVENLSKDKEKLAEESDSMKRELEKTLNENRRLAHEKEQLISLHQKEVEDLEEHIAECQEDKNDLNEEVSLSHLEIEHLEEEFKEAEIKLRVSRRLHRQQKQEWLKLISSTEELFMDNFTLVEKLKNAEAEMKRLKEHNEAVVEGYNYLKNIVNGLANPRNPSAENEAEPGIAAEDNDKLERKSEDDGDALEDEDEEAELVNSPEVMKSNKIEEEEGGIAGIHLFCTSVGVLESLGDFCSTDPC